MKKRLLAMIMAVVMAMSLLPVSAFAVFFEEPVGTYTFKDADDKEISGAKQILRKGEALQLPPAQEKAGTVFLGWAIDGTVISADYVQPEISEDTNYTVAPKFENVYYVTFSDGDLVYDVQKINDGAVNCDSVSYISASGKVLIGWSEDPSSTTADFTGKNLASKNYTVYPVVTDAPVVTFDHQDEAGTIQKANIEGSRIAEPSDPVRAGYTFQYWTENNQVEHPVAFNFNDDVTKDKTLYAVWEAQTVNYTVVFWKENADNTDYTYAGMEIRSTNAGSIVTPSNDDQTRYEREHFTFNAPKTGSVLVSGDGSTIFNIYYTRDQFTLTFKANDSSPTCGKNEHKHNQGCYKYVIVCNHQWWWQHDETCFETQLTCNKEEHRHTNACYGSGVFTITAKHGAYIADQFNFSGYEGRAWEATSYYDYALQTLDRMPTANVTFNLYGKSSDTLKTITYWVGALPGENAGTTYNGKNYVKLKEVSTYFNYATYEEEYHPIAGFSRLSPRDAGFQDNKKNFKDNKLDLYYIRESYPLQFYNYNAVAKEETVPYQADLSSYYNYVPTAPEGMESYTFGGWYLAPTCEDGAEAAEHLKTMPLDGAIVYAKWSAPTYTVNAYNTVTAKVPTSTDKVTKGSTITTADLPDVDTMAEKLEKSADDFLGWYDKEGQPFLSRVINSNIDLYAYWRDEAYKVTYVVGAGTVTDSNDYAPNAHAIVAQSTGITAPDGKVFDHWVDEADNSYKPNEIVSVPVGGVTLTAVYADALATDSTSVTYKANGGTGDDVSETVSLNNGTFEVNENTFAAPTGKTFDHWNTKADGTGDKYDPEDIAHASNPAEKNVLYAQWENNFVTFTFDANGGSWSSAVNGYTMSEGNTTASIEAIMGTKIAQIATEPTREGYEFVGWYSKNSDGELSAKWWGVGGFSYNIYQNDTVYAKWEKIPKEPTSEAKKGKLYVNLQDENGTWLGGTNEAIAITSDYTVSFTEGENVDYVAPEFITTTSGDRYIFDCVVDYSKPMTGTLQKDGEDIVVCLQYTKDNWNDKDDKTTGGDGIPDKYQALVIYEVKGGTWDGSDAEDKEYVFTLKEKDAETGEWKDIDPASVLGTTIPDVKNAKPDTTHTTPAYWTPTPYATDIVKSGTTVYTYTFTTAEKLTFTFNANGGSWTSAVNGYTMSEGNTTASIEAIMGTEIAQIATEPTREGYEFVGWYSKNSDGELSAKWWGVGGFIYNIYQNDTVYAKWKKIPKEPTSEAKKGKLYVNLQDENGTYLGGTDEAIEVTNTYTVSFTDGENVNYVIPEVITTDSGDRYIYEYVVDYSAPLNGTVKKNGENFVVCLQYTKDNWNDEKEELTGGDGIPDKYQAVIKYVSNNADYGTVTPELQVETIYDANENYAAEGTVSIGSDAKTTDLSRVYFSNWTYDGKEYAKEAKLTKDDFEIKGGETYTFTANFGRSSKPSSGNNNNKPTLNKEDHYAYIVGYPDGTVQPGGNITRAEVATIFFRMLTDDSRNEFWSQTNSYSDVSEGQWFNNAISTLANAGILSGYPDGTFRPNAPITRAEFTKIAASFFERVEYTIDNPFNDVDDDDWFYKFVMAAYEGGLITGYPEGDFRPNANISRAESVTIVNRTLGRAPDADHFLDDMIVWPDNAEDAWYYEAVQEATNSHEYVMKGSGDNKYENWTKILEVRDWPALEKEWSDANSATGGEVVK